LLAQLASQQKEITALKDEIASLKTKCEHIQREDNMQSISAPKWSNNVTMKDKIALEDIKNILEETRPNGTGKTELMLSNTDWKSISNALPQKQQSFKTQDSLPQKAYTVQKYTKRSFLPSEPVQTSRFIQDHTSSSSGAEEQTHRAPPQPMPKPIAKKRHIPKFVPVPESLRTVKVIEQNVNVMSYPKVRVERFHQ